MKIRISYRAAFQVASDKVCADLTAALKAIPHISDVSVVNLTMGTGTLKAKVSFFYAEAAIGAWLDSSFLRSDSVFRGFTTPDIIFEGAHETVDSMVAAIQCKYVGFLRVLLNRIVSEPLAEANLNRKQILIMRQTALIDAGFDAEAKLMPNGDFRLIVTHERVKTPLKEVKIA